MVADLPLLAVLVASAMGSLLGCATGLVPGLHTNNVAALLLVLVASAGDASLPTACAVVSCAVAHMLSSAVPGIFLAAPEGESVLGVLPGHRLHRAGRGDEALRLHVVGCLGAIAVSMAILLPLRWALAPPVGLHAALVPWLGPALLLGCALMALMEGVRTGPSARALRGWRAVAVAALLTLASAALGQMAVFDRRALLAGAGIGPLFVGLFGLPTILLAILDPPAKGTGPEVASEADGRGAPGASVRRRSGHWRVVLRGSLVGALVGWFPGTSSGQATMLAVVRSGDSREAGLEGAKRYVLGVAAVGTANVVFNIAALATFLRVRSGSAAAVGGLMGWTEAPWTGVLPPVEVGALLLAMAVGAAVAAPVVLAFGRRAKAAAPLLSDPRTLSAVAFALAALCVMTGGGRAALVLLAATCLGMLPPMLGVMRVHLMAAMTVPVAMGLLSG